MREPPGLISPPNLMQDHRPHPTAHGEPKGTGGSACFTRQLYDNPISHYVILPYYHYVPRLSFYTPGGRSHSAQLVPTCPIPPTLGSPDPTQLLHALYSLPGTVLGTYFSHSRPNGCSWSRVDPVHEPPGPISPLNVMQGKGKGHEGKGQGGGKGKGSDRTPSSRTQTPARDRTPSGDRHERTPPTPAEPASMPPPPPRAPQHAGGGVVVHTRTPEQFHEETHYHTQARAEGEGVGMEVEPQGLGQDAGGGGAEVTAQAAEPPPPAVELEATLPTAPIPGADSQEEIPLDDLGYIRFRQPFVPAGTERSKIQSHEVVAAYVMSAANLDSDLPMVPELGVGTGTGPFGPWDIYMLYEHAQYFSKQVSSVTVQDVELEVLAFRAMNRPKPPRWARLWQRGPRTHPTLSSTGHGSSASSRRVSSL